MQIRKSASSLVELLLVKNAIGQYGSDDSSASLARAQPMTRLVRHIPIALIFTLHVVLTAFCAARSGPTADEPANLVSGLAAWKAERFDLYKVNPPLVRLIAALPLLVLDHREDWTNPAGITLARPEFPLGSNFIKVNGARSFRLFTFARFACIPFSLFGLVACYLWGRELYGEASGLTAAALWAFDPNVVGHGSLISNDIAAAGAGLFAVLLLHRWSESEIQGRAAWSWAILAGLGLSVALLTKLSWCLAFVVWPAVWGLGRVCTRGAPRRSASGGILRLTLLLAITLAGLNIGYGCQGSMKPLGTYSFSSSALAGRPALAGGQGNRFQVGRLAAAPVPVPREYLLGIDLQKHDFESAGRFSYLDGVWRKPGWRYFYLACLWYKAPHGTQILFAASCLGLLFAKPTALSRGEITLLLPAIVFFAFVSSRTEFTRHLRYVLPTFGFLIVFSTRILGACRKPWPAIVGGIAVLATAASTLGQIPHTLSYYNELSGGPGRGPEHLLDSNSDWGQDLLRLCEWIDAHPEVGVIRTAYYGPCNPSCVSSRTEPLGQETGPDGSIGSRHDLRGAYCAVSVNYLYGEPFYLSGSEATPKRDPEPFLIFRRLHPVAFLGYGLRLYRLPDGGSLDATQMPRPSGHADPREMSPRP